MISSNTIGVMVDLVGLALAIGYGLYRLRDRRIVIDHRLLFTIGFIYYISVPSLLARTRTLDHYYVFIWTLYHRIPASRTLAFSCWSVLMLVAFHSGCAFAERYRAPAPSVPNSESMRSTQRWLSLACGLSLLLFFGVAAMNRSVIQSGYRSNDPTLIQSEAGRGLLAAAATVAAGLLLLYRSRLRDTPWPMGRVTSRTHLRNFVLVAMLLPIVGLLLATGGRLYASTILVAVAVWYSIAVVPPRRILLVVGGALAFVLLTAYGGLRTGTAPSPSELSLYATTESVQGSIALYNIMENDDREFDLIRAPIFLASDLVNVVPRVLLPNKDSLRITPEEQGFVLDNPLGGLNVGVSLLLNFGSFGSLVVIFLLGLGLTRLRIRSAEPAATVRRAIYSLISATLLMAFFRDYFSITIVRWWILICIIVIGSTTLMMRLLRRGPTGWHTATVSTSALAELSQATRPLPATPATSAGAGPATRAV